MTDKQVPINETDIKKYLINHLNEHWKTIVGMVANSNNGSSIFIRTIPCKDTINSKIEEDLPPLTMVLLSHNHSVYICYTDDKDGVYLKLQNVDTDTNKLFFAATDDNKIYGDFTFGKDCGTKIFPSVSENPDKNINYLNINWLTGEPV
jgi:hypothetical protein